MGNVSITVVEEFAAGALRGTSSKIEPGVSPCVVPAGGRIPTDEAVPFVLDLSQCPGAKWASKNAPMATSAQMSSELRKAAAGLPKKNARVPIAVA